MRRAFVAYPFRLKHMGPWALIMGLLVWIFNTEQWKDRLFDRIWPRVKIYSSCEQNAGWTLCFTPGGRCTTLIEEVLDQAKKSIYVQAYSFTSKPIARALIEAKKRGVKVVVLLDKSQLTEDDSVLNGLKKSGIEVRIDSKHQIAHNKVMIIDEKTSITGSFNFTYSAQSRNAENLLVVQDPKLAQLYLENWNEHESHSD